MFLEQIDVQRMSQNLFGMPYDALKVLIYPCPEYKTYIIKKRNGSPRIIQEPRLQLKAVQKKLLDFMYKHAGPPKLCVHGFTPKRSIVTNAKKHCSPRSLHLLNVDIEDFFPSINFYRVRGVFLKKPFGFSHSVATVLAQICTVNNSLPQGAPTSPMLANLVCRSLDKDLMDLAKRNHATYTRYSDDITFSFPRLSPNICSFDSGILALGDELQALFKAHNFRINPAKSRLSSSRHRLEVTGLIINKFPNVKRVYVDKIRGALHAWERYGYAATALEWEQKPYHRQLRTGVRSQLKAMLRGKLLFLHMVRSRDDALYTRLAEKYNRLCEIERAKDKSFAYAKLPIAPIVRNSNDVNDAVFVLEWSGDYKLNGQEHFAGGQGTAFAYKNIGLITCDHLFRYQDDFTNLIDIDDVPNANIIIKNPISGKEWRGKIVHRDKYRDLAVIKFDDRNSPTHRHFIGLETPITRNAKGFLIGFPNQSAGKQANVLQSTVINSFPLTCFQRIEISNTIRKGNSGGPFVDENFRVAGVAQQGATQGEGNDQCLCVTELDKWLANLNANQKYSEHSR